MLADDARFCPECGAPNVDFSPPAVDERGTIARSGAVVDDVARRAMDDIGERRQLTVLFSDLVGSTELSTRLDAEEWRDVIAAYHRSTAEIVARFGGHVAKYLGDGVLALFGYPRAHDEDAERAVRAALAIVDAKIDVDDELPLQLRVGIHTGPVVVAASAGEAFDVFGETPNVAARVQQLAQPNAVVLTGATLRLVRGIFVIEELGAQQLKGIAEPIELYRALQPSGVRSRLEIAADRLTLFVGRDLELGTLVDRWERTVEGEGQAVLITGEAGVGKSRLVYQLREQFGDTPHTWFECGCSPYTQETAFHPIIALVQQGLGLGGDDTGEDKVSKVERALASAGLPLAEAVPLFAEFLGLPAPAGYAPLAIAPEVQRKRTIRAVVEWMLALGELQPIIVLVEDLHWADPSSLELLGYLIDQTPTAHVLVVLTTRPEFTAGWPSRSHLTPLQVSRLTRRQAREMVEALSADVEPLVAAVADEIVTRADGIPLYLEELTKAVVQPGAARSLEAIPATLQDSLMARLDRLSAAKAVAQRAAVLGREFSYALAVATVGIEEGALRQGLGRLVDAEILFTRGEPPLASYTFKHALVQEAAYGSLLKRTRQELHARVVRALTTQFPERAAAEPEVVARHAQAALLVDAAVTYYQLAGKQAQERSAHAEAIGHLRKALGVLVTLPHNSERDERELPLQLALGSSLIATQGWGHDETRATWDRARTLCESVEDTTQSVRALNGMVSVYSNAGDVDHAVEVAEQILQRAEEAGDDVHRFVAHSVMAGPRYFQGQFASSLTHCERACVLFDPSRHGNLALDYGTDPHTNALILSAWNLWQLGYPERARDRVGESIAAARATRYPFTLCQALLFQATSHWMHRDYASQRAVADEVIARSEEQGFPLWHGLARAFRAAADITSAADVEKVTELVKGLSQAARTGQQLGSPSVLALLAEAQERAEVFGPALHAVELGLASSERTGQHFFDAELHRLRGSILIAQAQTGASSDAHEAEACFRRAIEIAQMQEARSFELRATTSLARLLRARGDRAEARRLLASIYDWFNEGFDERDLCEAKALLDAS